MSETAPQTNTISAIEIASQLVNQENAPSAQILELMLKLNAAVKMSSDPNQTSIREEAFIVCLERFITAGEPDFHAIIDLLRMKAEWSGNRPSFGNTCATYLKEAAKTRRLILSKIDSCEFGVERPVESLKRLRFLLDVKPGTIVVDRTWGFGIVTSEDTFYKRVNIKFDQKPGNDHSMAFSFAANSLTAIPDWHVLAVRHENPAAFAEMVEKEPGKVVKLTLQSFTNPMTTQQLQTLMTSQVLPPQTDWKNFWAQARRQLSDDPSIQIPPASKKNAIVSVVSNPVQDSEMESRARFEQYRLCRDPKLLLEQTAAFTKGANLSVLTDEQREIVRDRIAFILRAAVADIKLGNRVKIQAILLALHVGFEEITTHLGAIAEDEFAFRNEFTPGTDNTIDLRATLCMPSIILDAAKKLPATKMKELVEQMQIATDPMVADAFIATLQQMPSNLVEYIAPALLTGVGSEAFVNSLQEIFSSSYRVPFPLLRWACYALLKKDLAAVFTSKVMTPFAVLSLALACIEYDVSGEDLRMKNEIKKLFVAGASKSNGAEIEDGTRWLVPLFEKMFDDERINLFARIYALEGVWEPLKKRNLISSLLNNFPNLSVYIPKEEEAPELGFFVENVTSVRSYRERKSAYDKLMNEEMPRNRQDIEHAKSFGDLSENFEYESAKATERALIARQEAYEKDLEAVKEFDFATAVPEQSGLVGMGSTVSVSNEDGSRTSYAILGEWDSEPALGIISCLTPLAHALIDHRVGDTVVVSLGDEEKTVRITSIDPLSQEVLDWAK